MIGFKNWQDKFVLLGSILGFKDEFMEDEWYLEICVYKTPDGNGSISVIDGLLEMVCPD